jgi:hypothetical protein
MMKKDPQIKINSSFSDLFSIIKFLTFVAAFASGAPYNVKSLEPVLCI